MLEFSGLEKIELALPTSIDDNSNDVDEVLQVQNDLSTINRIIENSNKGSKLGDDHHKPQEILM